MFIRKFTTITSTKNHNLDMIKIKEYFKDIFISKEKFNDIINKNNMYYNNLITKNSNTTFYKFSSLLLISFGTISSGIIYIRNEIKEDIKEVENRLNNKIDKLDNKIDKLDTKINNIEKQLNDILNIIKK